METYSTRRCINDCGCDRRNGELADAKAAIFRWNSVSHNRQPLNGKSATTPLPTPRPFEVVIGYGRDAAIRTLQARSSS